MLEYLDGSLWEAVLDKHLGGVLPVVPLEDEDAVLHRPSRRKPSLHLRAEFVQLSVTHLQALNDRGGLSETSHFHAYFYSGLLPIELRENVLETFVQVFAAHCSVQTEPKGLISLWPGERDPFLLFIARLQPADSSVRPDILMDAISRASTGPIPQRHGGSHASSG